MNKTSRILPAVLLILGGGIARATDGFGAVSCGSDVPKALVGKAMSNERVVVLEARHKNIGLKDLGGSEVSERLFLASWQICGKEYALLEEKDVVRDVLEFPAHSKDAPEFTGSCQRKGKQEPGTIIAVLENRKGAGALPAKAAWKIDEVGKKFVRLPTEALTCPRDGVITADGGP